MTQFTFNTVLPAKRSGKNRLTNCLTAPRHKTSISMPVVGLLGVGGVRVCFIIDGLNS